MGAVAKVVGIRVASSPAFPQAKTGVGAPAEIVFGRRDPGRACRRSRPALDDGGVLPAREGAWPRPLRGTLLAWVAPPHEPVHGRRCASGEVGRRSAPIRFRQTERNESGRSGRSLTSLGALLPTVPEIRYLVSCSRAPPDPPSSWHGRSGADGTKPTLNKDTTAAGTKCNCSIRAVRVCTESGNVIYMSRGSRSDGAHDDGTVVSGSARADRAVCRSRNFGPIGCTAL